MKTLLTTLLLTTLAFGGRHKADAPTCSTYANSIVCGDHVATQAEIQQLAAGTTPSSAAAPASLPRDSRGRIRRSPEVRAEFEREHPCPSTGRTSGACPGFVADHRIALCKGGPDAVSNLQWQSVTEAKAKDKIECK